MSKLDVLLRSPRATRLYWLAWSLLALAVLALNGRYQPVPGRPTLVLDTWTGQLHLGGLRGLRDDITGSPVADDALRRTLDR